MSEIVDFARAHFGRMTIPGDPEGLVAAIGPGFEMHLVGVGGEPVHYAGEAGIREFFADVEQSWESLTFEGTDFRDLGGRVLVLADVHGRGRTSGIDVEDRWGWIVEVNAGRAVSIRGFLDERLALEAAGLTD